MGNFTLLSDGQKISAVRLSSNPRVPAPPASHIGALTTRPPTLICCVECSGLSLNEEKSIIHFQA